IKWDVKNGRARTDSHQVGACKQLEGSPYVQGIEIRSGIHVKVSCFQSVRLLIHYILKVLADTYREACHAMVNHLMLLRSRPMA
ncbi:hypothetical protein FocTR4_00003420, partial [Fusarium oxysporum f. sp. cubense]